MTVLSATDFDFLNARLRGMRSRLFEGPRLAALTETRRLPDLAEAVLGEPLDLTAGSFQRRLAADHVADLARLSRHMRGCERDFFLALLERYRTENLKVVLRWRADPHPRTSPAPLLVPLPDRLELPYERLIAEPDLAGLIRALPEKRLVKAGLMGLDAGEDEGGTFFLEAALDEATFAFVLEKHGALPRSARAATAEILGRELDVYGIMFVARASQTYSLAWDAIAPFLPEPGPDTSAGLLQRVHGAADPAAVLALVPQAATGRRDEADAADLAAVERLLWRRLAARAGRLFHQSLFDLGMAAAYVYLKRVELFNLIRIVEGVRYHLSPAEMGARLIDPGREKERA